MKIETKPSSGAVTLNMVLQRNKGIYLPFVWISEVSASMGLKKISIRGPRFKDKEIESEGDSHSKTNDALAAGMEAALTKMMTSTMQGLACSAFPAVLAFVGKAEHKLGAGGGLGNITLPLPDKLKKFSKFLPFTFDMRPTKLKIEKGSMQLAVVGTVQDKHGAPWETTKKFNQELPDLMAVTKKKPEYWPQTSMALAQKVINEATHWMKEEGLMKVHIPHQFAGKLTTKNFLIIPWLKKFPCTVFGNDYCRVGNKPSGAFSYKFENDGRALPLRIIVEAEDQPLINFRPGKKQGPGSIVVKTDLLIHIGVHWTNSSNVAQYKDFKLITLGAGVTLGVQPTFLPCNTCRRPEGKEHAHIIPSQVKVALRQLTPAVFTIKEKGVPGFYKDIQIKVVNWAQKFLSKILVKGFNKFMAETEIPLESPWLPMTMYNFDLKVGDKTLQNDMSVWLKPEKIAELLGLATPTIQGMLDKKVKGNHEFDISTKKLSM